MTNFLNFSFSFHELLQDQSLRNLDKEFLETLPKTLQERMAQLRQGVLGRREVSAIIMAAAPFLENYLRDKFQLPRDHITTLMNDAKVIHEAKVRFIRRRALTHTPVESSGVTWEEICHQCGKAPQEVDVAQALVNADESADENACRFWIAVCQAILKNPLIVPQMASWGLWNVHNERLDEWLPDAHDHDYQDPTAEPREDFALWTKVPSESHAADHAHYCLYCHERDKDYCSQGHPQIKSQTGGCPLEQKISEMNAVYAQGYGIGALAIIMVDNPLVAATGHRICNACRQHCIFQKQESVDIPAIESRILHDVLRMPYGFEIYALLTRWNPLKSEDYYPEEPTGKSVLIVGQGPAGFALALQLLNHGHHVFAIDALPCTDVRDEDLHNPLILWTSENLQERTARGFGGVAEYGITARWDKSLLFVIQLLLRRRHHYTLMSAVRWGSQIDETIAEKIGFDHIAFCTGAGHPSIPTIPNHLSKGVRTATDFLMQLHLTSANKKGLSRLQIELPVVVVGGGLTAIDAATEALAYYPKQVRDFAENFDKLSATEKEEILASSEGQRARTFLAHARELAVDAQDKKALLQKLTASGGVTIVYRGNLKDSPAYKSFPSEIQSALSVGVRIVDETDIASIETDNTGQVHHLTIKQSGKTAAIPAKTLLWATGFYPHDCAKALDAQTFLVNQGTRSVSFFGDCHPVYKGSVVHALASAKRGAPQITRALKNQPARSEPANVLRSFRELLASQLHNITYIDENLVYFVIKNQGCAQNYQAGQYFRLQWSGSASKTFLPAFVDKDLGEIGFITKASSLKDMQLDTHASIPLMGPVGAPLTAPDNATLACSDHFALQALCIAQHLSLQEISISIPHGKLLSGLHELSQELYPHIRQKTVMSEFSEQAFVRILRKGVAECELILLPIQCAMGGVCGRCLVDISQDNQQKAIFACTNLWHNPCEISLEARLARKEGRLWDAVINRKGVT